jgi:hypothetical protein
VFMKTETHDKVNGVEHGRHYTVHRIVCGVCI